MSPFLVDSFGTTVGARTSVFVHLVLQSVSFLFMSTRTKPGSVTAPELGPNGSW